MPGSASGSANSTASCCSISDRPRTTSWRTLRAGRGRRRPTGASPRPPRSTAAACRSTRAIRSPPSTAPTACAPPARRRSGARLPAGASSSIAASSRPGSTSPACSPSRAASMRRGAICSRAIALDADYADAVYNLAELEFDAGNLAEARRWWARYLELDSDFRLGAHRRARHPVRRSAAARNRPADGDRFPLRRPGGCAA